MDVTWLTSTLILLGLKFYGPAYETIIKMYIQLTTMTGDLVFGLSLPLLPYFVYAMRGGSRVGTGGPDPPPPPEKSQKYWVSLRLFLSNTGLDSLKITKLPSQH